ncbi:MAG: DUF6788 family protein [Candidatus Helarchaeota archaeon]
MTEIVLKEDDLFNLLEELNKRYTSLMQKKKELVLQIKDCETGIIIYEYVKCGKKNCKCYSEGPSHGPYYYRYYWIHGKLKKEYICPVNKTNEFFDELYEKIENNKKNKLLQKEIKRLENSILRIRQLKDKFKKEILQLLQYI